MRIPSGFLGSCPVISPLLWSRESAWGSAPKRGASACGAGPCTELAAWAALALGFGLAPDGATYSGPPDSESVDGDGWRGGRERDDEMESLRLPTETREGETERDCLCTLAKLGAGMGSTSGAWDGDRER